MMPIEAVLLPPANEVCEGYVFTPVCQSFCSQGGSIWAGNPPPRTRHTPQDQIHPWDQVHPPAVHAGRYGQQAGGTHPTGMHSCSDFVST